MPKFVRFRMLKNSLRNWRFKRSEIAVFFLSERSRVESPGPVSVLRPRFPYVPKTGTMKAFGLKYWDGLPSITLPLKFGLMEGRTGLRLSPLLEGLKPSCGVKGRPDWNVTMALVVHPLRVFCCHGLPPFSQSLPCSKGCSYVQ